MCHCMSRTSQIPQQQITNIYASIGGFVSNPLKHPNPEQIQFVQPDYQIPNPLEYDSAAEFQAAIVALAEQHPDSIYEFALYAFRRLDVNYPQVYVRAAMRDYNVKQLAQGIKELSDALLIVCNIAGRDSIFGSRDRIAMPDETLYFKTGSDRDKALLLYTLLQHSPISDTESVIGLSNENSFVSHQGKWIDLENLSLLSAEPLELKILFNATSTLYTLIVVLTLTYWSSTARLVRAEVLSIRERSFVEAARAIGASHTRIVFHEILPNAFPLIVTNVMLMVGGVILVEAGLSFIGLGDANYISWGYMLHNGQHFIRDAWWMIFFPTLAVSLLVFALNAVGDRLNHALDPKSRLEHFDKPA